MGNDVCSIPFYDTLFLAPDGKTYAIKGTQYWIISSRTGLESGPHKVTDLWEGLPQKVDAAYQRSSYRLVFFSGSRYVVFPVSPEFLFKTCISRRESQVSKGVVGGGGGSWGARDSRL